MAKKPDPEQAVMSDDGFKIVRTSELKPFVNWDETPTIEGNVSNFRTIKGGKYGDQDAVDVGEYSVGLTAALISLPEYEGKYIRIRYEGEGETKKGNKVKKFTVLERIAAPK